MIKVIIINEDLKLSNKLKNFTLGVKEVEVLGIFQPGSKAINAIKKYNPDFIIMEPSVACNLNETQANFVETTMVRQHISASTHHGIQLLPISAVYYFQAEHKYVIAHHEQGELLINDPLVSLEQEFSALFIRIHRKLLVAKAYIKALEKTEDGKWCIVLTNYTDKLAVSRRQLAVVRKYINEYARN